MVGEKKEKQKQKSPNWWMANWQTNIRKVSKKNKQTKKKIAKKNS